LGDGGGSGSSNVCARATVGREFLAFSGDDTGAGFEDSRLLLLLSAEYAACNTAGADCGKSRSRLMWRRFEEAL